MTPWILSIQWVIIIADYAQVVYDSMGRKIVIQGGDAGSTPVVTAIDKDVAHHQVMRVQCACMKTSHLV